MSSAEDDYNDTDNPVVALPGSKKRRVQRACDICRRKKIRCDGSQMPGNRCSNCIAYNFECTYVEAAKKRGPPKGYVESLENRLEKMEKLLQKICPDGNFNQELGGGPIDRETWSKRALVSVPQTSASVDDLVPSDEEEVVRLRLTESIRNMNLSPMTLRFFGKSSGVTLIQKAMDLKKEYTGEQHADLLMTKRQDYEESAPWELAGKAIEEPKYQFPEEDLGRSLIDEYFRYCNVMQPLLHRPSFEKSVAEGLHLRDSSFGSVYLLVCAVGSRTSQDPRIFLEGVESEHSCGWKWFEQVHMIRRSLLDPPCLHDLQVYCLSVLFLQGSSAPQACWTMVGIGVRLAQDVGAHRRKVYNSTLTVEDELWKRAFWVLVSLDRSISAALGRPCAIQDEDFDVDLPVECDDEYWEHPDSTQAFKQPADKPSYVSYFVSFLKLNQILAFALRTIYSINKSKVLLGFVGQRWEQHIVAELDSALNKWIDSVPDHLRWDPNREDKLFFLQSACLYASYYHLQIIIHRPFIPSPRKPSPLSFPSLTICTNAARSCSHVIDIQRRRSGQPNSLVMMPAFTAGIVLLLNIWGGKRSGLSTDPSKEMVDVYKCMSALKLCERRWHSAGRLWDVLYELASVGDLPLPQPSPINGTKRERDSDSPASVAMSPLVTTVEGPRTIAGSRRVSKDVPSQSQPQMQPPTLVQAQSSLQHQQPQQHPPPPSQAQSRHPSSSNTFSLPVYSNDLGRLPLHGQLDFASLPPPSLEPPSDLWYPSLNQSSAPSAQAGPSSVPAPSYRNVGPPYMEDIFYDQMANQFTGSYGTPVPPGTGASHSQFDQSGPSPMQSMISEVNAQQSVLPHPGPQGTMDSDTIAMWSNAPTGFELDDWGTYITNVSSEMVQQGGAGSHANHPR